MSEVARNTWITGFSASLTASQQASMSLTAARASPATATPFTWRAISLTAARSPGDAAGKPASIMSTLRRTSFSATWSFSSVVIVAPGDCSPSRKVVSKIRMTAGSAMISFPPCRDAIYRVHPGYRVVFLHLCLSNFRSLINGFEPGHHRAQVGSDMLDLMPGIGLAHGREAGAACLVFQYPACGKGAILDFAQDAAHLVARAFVNDARAGDIVAKFGGVTDGVTHVAHAALVHQIHDQLHLVHALEVGDFRLVAGVDKCLEACADQRGDAAAKHRLLAEQIGFGLFGNGSAQDTRARAADGARIGQC